MNKILLLVILFTSYVVIQQHIIKDFERQPVVVVATEKPKKVVGYPAPPTSEPLPTWPPTQVPLPTAFPTQVPHTPVPYETPDMSDWCELAPSAWFCAP